MSRIPLSSIIYKCLRFYRLSNDQFNYHLFTFESTQYPRSSADCANLKDYFLASGRIQDVYDPDKKEFVKVNIVASVSTLEAIIKSSSDQLSMASDPDVHISSANPNQKIHLPSNSYERSNLAYNIRQYTGQLSTIRGALYKIVLESYQKIRFSDLNTDIIYDHIRVLNDSIVQLCPNSINSFASIRDNLDSENPEDWANAVHSCRRLLKDVADSLYPPSDDKISKGSKQISIDEEHYINRLMLYVDDNLSKTSPTSVLNSTLDQIGNRIDAVYHASCKGTHTDVTKTESRQYVIYTFLLLGDILSLKRKDSP